MLRLLYVNETSVTISWTPPEQSGTGSVKYVLFYRSREQAQYTYIEVSDVTAIFLFFRLRDAESRAACCSHVRVVADVVTLNREPFPPTLTGHVTVWLSR